MKFEHPDADELAAALRKAILDDLMAIEAYHLGKAAGYRRQPGSERLAEHETELANGVRGCIVTAQAAVNRVIGV